MKDKKQGVNKQQKQWRYPSIISPHLNKQNKQTILRMPTLLDQFNNQSQLNKSDFKGFFNMIAIFSIIFLFTKPIINKIQRGYFFEPYLYQTFKNDYVLCLMVWPLFFLWSFTSFLLQKMVLMNVNYKIIVFFQHLTQLGLFVFSSYLIFTRNWCSSHAAFVLMQTCVHFMKMHSYTTVNRDYRQQRIQAQKQNKKILSDYPNNINIKDFILFMWTPWLVYDVYPRKQTRSILYIIKKSIVTLIAIIMAYLVHTQYIIPQIQIGGKYYYAQMCFKLMLQTIFLMLLMFYIIFQNICNIFAQITKLDNRYFYQDFWNSTTYQQFNRKWNRPVHLFLYRHVYLQLILRWKVRKNTAQMITFLFSAALHQYLVAVIFRIILPFFMGFIVFQVPLIYFTKSMKGRRQGIYFFWFGMLIGPPIILSCYFKASQDVQNLFLRNPPINYQGNFTETIL